MEIVSSSASHHAMLFAFAAKEAITAFGSRGETAVIEAVHTYGLQRGRRMAMRAERDGIPRDAMSYELYSEWDCFPGQVEREDSRENGVFCMHYKRCPWFTEWKSAGFQEYGKYYCGHVDAAILEGFGTTRGELASSRMFGAETCDLVFRGPCCTQEAYETLTARKFLLGKQAVMPWEYHVGHLYQALLRSMERSFGLKGLRVMQRALKCYVRQFGKEAGELVLRYADLDYDALPPYTAPLRQERREKLIDRMIETDILVAGGSGAAVMAAIEASKGGRVLLVSKGRSCHSGNMIMAGGGFGIDGASAKKELHMQTADGDFTREKLLDCLLKEGFGLCRRSLTEQYVSQGPEAMQTFLDWAEKAGQHYDFLPGGSWIGSGWSFSKAVAQGLKEHPGIRRMDDCVVLDVLTTGGRVSGALVLELYTGALILVRVKAVILATGGYQPFSVSCSASDMTGDGQAMALRAGAKLSDMEFVLGMPVALEPPGMKGSIYPFVFEFNLPGLRYRLLDRDMRPLELGQELLDRFRGKKISKLVNSWVFAQAKAQGRLTDRDGLYLDYSENSPEERKAALDRFFDRFQKWYPRGCYNGESLSGVVDAIMQGKPLEVTIGYEYSLGGIRVDTQMQTGVAGLFAAGEVTTGCFGACRAGDGLLEMLVQGRQAGKSAARFSHRRDYCPVDTDQMQRRLSHHLRYFRPGAVSSRLLFSQIQQACTAGMGILRTRQSLLKTRQELSRLQLQLDNLCAIHTQGRAYNMEWLQAIQCENLLTCCQCAVQAALERKESRGVHIRGDYPEMDNARQLKHYTFSMEDGALKMESEPVEDRGGFLTDAAHTVESYLLDPELQYSR